MIFQTLLFGLTIVAYRKRVQSKSLRRTILYVFIRDGAWAYCAMLGESVTYQSEAAIEVMRRIAVQILNLSLNILEHQFPAFIDIDASVPDAPIAPSVAGVA